MSKQFIRTEMMFGREGMERLYKARVAVFGVGGVGGHVVEALARSGVGELVLVDHDTVSLTNINRQILATRATVGMSKARAAEERVRSIDPEIRVTVHETFFGPETAGEFDFSRYSYVIDAIDTVTGKLALIGACKAAGTPIICSMGTGNKLDPTRFQVADISKTSVCPLARIMRKECAKRGYRQVKVVFSTEDPVPCPLAEDDPAWAELPEGRRALPGSVAFVPAMAGMILAGEVIRDLAQK